MHSRVAIPPRQADPIAVRPPIPFAQVPRDLTADPRLTPTDKVVADLVAGHAYGGKASCWPGNESLARDAGRSVRTVQYALRHLEATGWIRCEPADNPTGRLIVLTWRVQPVACPPVRPVAPEEDRVVKKKNQIQTESGITTRPETPRPVIVQEPPQTPRADAGLFAGPPAILRTPTPGPAQPPPPPRPEAAPRRPSRAELMARCRAEMAEKAADDPILAAELARRSAPRPETPPPPPEDAPTTELIARVKEGPAVAARLIHRLTVDLKDEKSYQGFRAVVERAWRGEIPPEVLSHAYAKAMGPQVRNAGAIFMTEIKRGQGG